MSTIELEIPAFIQEEVAEAASQRGVTPAMFMLIAIAEKAAESRTIKKMSEPERQAARERILQILEKAPARKPMKGDEIPAKLRKRLEKKFPVLKRLSHR